MEFSTVDEYHEMARAGILTEEDRVELIDGEIIEMGSIGSPHAACVDRLNQLFGLRLATRAIVRVQNPFRLDRYSEPVPDLTIPRPKASFHSEAHPMPPDVLLVIEVADPMLAFDRKIKLPLYARTGTPEMWLVNIKGECIEIFRELSGKTYREQERKIRGLTLSPSPFPDVSFGVEEILG